MAGINEGHPAPVGLGPSKVSYELAVHVSALALLAVVAHEGHHGIGGSLPDGCNPTPHVPQRHRQEVLIYLHVKAACLQDVKAPSMDTCNITSIVNFIEAQVLQICCRGFQYLHGKLQFAATT